jgi:hypothetical protein
MLVDLAAAEWLAAEEEKANKASKASTGSTPRPRRRR